MTEKCLDTMAKKYVPHFRYDKKEPFSIQGIGYTIYRKTGKSSSCSRTIRVRPGETVLEYAVFYDFDIQHLYDLEHVFVYVNAEGEVTGVESSFHGKFLNSFIKGQLAFEEKHPVLYVQPGKHAMMPAPHYFELALDKDAACMELAGIDGLLIAPMFEGRITTDDELNRLTEHFLKTRYRFVPSWEFTAERPGAVSPQDLLMPYTELDTLIVQRVHFWKEKIRKDCGKE